MEAASPPDLPRLDKMFLIGIWIETVLYGMNVLIYGTALYVLSQKWAQPSSRILVYVSSLAFLVSTAYVAVSLRQLLEAFVDGPTGAATLYFANEASPLPQSKIGLYTVNVCLQDVVLIWRLWILYGKRWQVVVVPLCLEATRLGASIVAMIFGGRPGVSIFDKTVHDMGILDWTSDLALNIGVTAFIALRIWLHAREIARTSLKDHARMHTNIVLIIIESGSLFAVATLVTVVLYLSNNPATVVAIDSVVQLATITPLLIVVRVAFGLTHGSSSKRGFNYDDAPNLTGGSLWFAAPMRVSRVETRQGEDTVEEYPMSTLSGVEYKAAEVSV